MTEPKPTIIEGEWERWRYLITGGDTLDVISPNRSNSKDRDVVLQLAAQRYGVDETRRIEGSTRVERLKVRVEIVGTIDDEPTVTKPRARKKAT